MNIHLPVNLHHRSTATTSHTTYPLWRILKKMIFLPLLWGTTLLPVAGSTIETNNQSEKPNSYTLDHAAAPSVIPSRAKELPIPADGNCLYNSLVMDYLLPVAEDGDLFKARLTMLVGEDKIMPTEETENNQNNNNNDDNKIDNHNLWNLKTLRQTFLQLRRANLVYYLYGKTPFPPLYAI